MSTAFEPDTAFLLKSGEMMFQASYNLLNSYVYSSNSDKNGDPTASADSFSDSPSTGYSVYFDGELDRRFFKFSYGFSDNIELQFTYRDFRIFPGNLDSSIEGFHSFLGIGNQGRENTDQDLLEIHIHDNESGENVFSVVNSMDKFHQESMTLGVRLKIRETAKEAVSFSIASNFGDQYIEQEINDASVDTDKEDHRNFNDYNVALRYTSIFDDWTLHAAFSITFSGRSLLQRSPREIYYYFLGVGWRISDHWDYLLQTLEYSSPFPKDSTSTINADIREITTGFRWLLNDHTALDFGLTENQSQGPQNIDIAFFSNFMFSL